MSKFLLLLICLTFAKTGYGDPTRVSPHHTVKPKTRVIARNAVKVSRSSVGHRNYAALSYSDVDVNTLEPAQLAPYEPQAPQVTRYVGNATANYVGEFDPALAGGVPGYPGIRVRINIRTFQWASSVARQLIDQTLPRMPIPTVTENVQEFHGTVQVYNAYVSKYRTPSNVAVYPVPPNRLMIAVEDFDIGITGNLGGQIVVLLPLPLCGIIHVDLYRVTARITVSLGRDATGAPCLLVDGCEISIGYVDVCVDNGGLIGMAINMLFRQQIAEKIRQMIPGRVCAMIPQIIAEKLNPRLKSIPQTIPFTDMASLAQGLLRSNVPEYCNSPYCLNRKKASKSVPIPSSLGAGGNETSEEEYTNPFANSSDVRHAMRRMRLRLKKLKSTAHMAQQLTHLRTARSPEAPTAVPLPRSFYKKVRQTRQPATPVKRQQVTVVKPAMRHSSSAYQLAAPRARASVVNPKAVVRKSKTTTRISTAPKARGISVAETNPAAPDPCDSCPSNDAFGMIKELLVSAMDLRKLADLLLRVQIINAYASNYDMILDINGDFSPGGVGGLPFGPYPLMFPATSNKMIDVLISDYTINSLLYYMHKRAFLAFLVNSQTPKIGDLLKTTCGDEETEDEDITSAETETSDEKEENTLRRYLKHLKQLLKRNRRQTDGEGGGLSDLGICIGDIMPDVREKYPNKTLTLFIHTARAPSIVLSGQGGGMATVDLILLIDILVDGTNDRAGTLTVTVVLDIGLQFYGTRISAVLSLRTFKVEDKEGTLGLPQDALDNLANMAKEMMVKSVNEQFKQPISISIPATNLPIRLNNPEVHVVDHAILISSDFDVSPSLFSGIMRRR